MTQPIIPFGEECYTCQSIDSKFNSCKSYSRQIGMPFDYVGHTYIEKINENIVDLLNSKNFFLNYQDFEPTLFEIFIIWFIKNMDLNIGMI